MNDITRKRIMRQLENLPDEVLYEVIDFIDFIEKRHGVGKEGPSPFQRIAESVEDVLRAGRMPVAAIKGTMQVVDAAGKVMDGISAAGESVVHELQKASERPKTDDGADNDDGPTSEERPPSTA